MAKINQLNEGFINMKKYNFTLTEAVVICVMAALCVVVAVPAVNGSAAQGKNVGCMNNLRKIGGYVQIYADQNKDYLPATSGCHQAGGDASFSSAPGTLFRTVIAPGKAYDSKAAPAELKRLFQCPEDKTKLKSNQIGYVWWNFGKKCRHRKGEYLREMRSGEQGKRAIVTDFCLMPGLLNKPAYKHADDTLNVLYADGAVKNITPDDMDGVKGWEHLINFDDLHPSAGE